MKTTDYKAVRYIVFLLLIVVFSSNKVIGQYDKELSYIFYNKGAEMYNQKRYKEADSLFTKAIKAFAFNDAFYNLAMTKRVLKDVCGYCNYLDSAAQYGDEEAEKLFNKNCIRKDSIFYDNTLHPDTICYSITETATCSNSRKIKFYNKTIHDDRFTSSDYYEEDSIIKKAQDIKFFLTFKKSEYETLKSYPIVEAMPQFPGGEQALREYIANNVKYPDLAKENGIYGKVIVYFVINENGLIEQIEVKRKVNLLLDSEAVRVIKNMPKWKPGTQRGKTVKVSFTVPINFALN